MIYSRVRTKITQERWLVMDTTQAELDYIATRAREAQLAMEAGSAGSSTSRGSQ